MRQQRQNRTASELSALAWAAGQVDHQRGSQRPAKAAAERCKRCLRFVPSVRMSSASPGAAKRSHTASVASGVTSRGASPVPPVVTMNAASNSRQPSVSHPAICSMLIGHDDPSAATCASFGQCARHRWAGKVFANFPAKHRSLTVITVAERPFKALPASKQDSAHTSASALKMRK